jgi:hypothetical protein
MERRGGAVEAVAGAVASWRLHARWAEGFAPDAVQEATEMERAQLGGLARALRGAVKHLLSAAGTEEPPQKAAPDAAVESAPAPGATEQYVTLDKAAAIVQRKKKTLERALHAKGSTMPQPDVEGGGGSPHEWVWTRLRPWLEERFGRRLPERYPRLTDT